MFYQLKYKVLDTTPSTMRPSPFLVINAKSYYDRSLYIYSITFFVKFVTGVVLVLRTQDTKGL